MRAPAAFTRWLCMQWPIRGPRGASCSGYAWNSEQRGCWWGGFWRRRIDGAFLFWCSQENHCRGAWAKDIGAATGADRDRLLAFDMRARDHQTALVLAAALRPRVAPVVPYFVAEDDVQEGT